MNAGSTAGDGGAAGGTTGAEPVGPDGGGRTATAPVLYVNESLSRRRQDIFQALLAEKRAGRLYAVFTKNGEVFCKASQFGRKVRVESLEKITHALQG